MTRPTVAGLADPAIDPVVLRDSLTDVDRRLLAGGLAAEVVEVVES